MTKDKDRDDELIGDARKLDEARNLEAIRRSPVIGPGIPFDDMTVFKHYRKLVRTGWQPPAEPEPDRAEVLAGEVISAANIVSYDGYYELDEEAVTTIIRRHFAELRAEWEAERPAVVVPMSAKMWAESVLNLRGAINATCEREAARFILSIDGAKGDE